MASTLRSILFLSLLFYSSPVIYSQSTLLVSTIDSICAHMEKEEAFDTLTMMSSKFMDQGDWVSWKACKKGIIAELWKSNLKDRLSDSLQIWILTKDIPIAHLAYLNHYQGFIKTNKGNTLLGIEWYKEAYTSYKILKDSTSLLKVGRNLGNNYSRLNDHPTARLYYKKALAYAMTPSKKERLKLDIVRSYIYQGEYDKALHYCDQNFSQAISNPEVLLAKVIIYINKNQLDEAQRIFLSVENTPRINYRYQNTYLELLQAKGELEAAISIKNEIIESWGKGNRRDYMAELVELSMLHVENSAYKNASSILDTVIQFFAPEFTSTGVLFNPKSSTTLSIWLVEALQLKGDIFAAASELQDLKKAKHYYVAAFDVLLKLKQEFVSYLSKYEYGVLSRAIASKLIEINYTAFQLTKNENSFNEAFRTAQNANAFVLKNAVEIRSLLNHPSVDNKLKNKFLELRYKVAQTTDSISASVLQEYDETKQQLYNQIEILEKYQYQIDHTADIKSIQECIQAHSLFVKYFFANNECYIFYIDKRDYVFFKIDLPKEYPSWISSITEITIKPATAKVEQDFLEASHEIFKLLVDPIVKRNTQIEHLIIVPDADLRKISFASLVKKPSENWIDQGQYLIDDYSISYLYYALQIRNKERRKKKKAQLVGLGLSYSEDYLEKMIEQLGKDFADNAKLDRLRLKELNHSITEVEKISSIFDGMYYTNTSVTGELLQQSLQENDIIHFTGHTWIDANDYLNSSLLIYPDSFNQSYYFSNSDILQLNLSNELVVLSTCESSYGKLLEGEGVESLGRSFTYSGAHAVLGNYWKIPDHSSSSIMTAFYENLQKGQRKDLALREAQLEYLKDYSRSSPLTQSPRYWAGWVLYGDYEPLVQNNYWPYFMVFLLIGCFLLFVFLRKDA